MASLFILLVLPAFALARIDVQLIGGFQDSSHNDLKVYYSGSDIGLISETDKKTFELSDANLKDAIRAYFGKRPDDAYLRSPTPWGDLYKTYGWDQVQRTLVPRSGKILEINTKPVIVMKQIFENNSSKPTTFDVAVSQSVQNTVRSSWSTGGAMQLEQEINYELSIELLKVGSKTKFQYSSSFGRNTEKSETITLGSTSGMQILLQPKQSVVAELHATRGSIKMEVEYEASLSGTSAVNYADWYKGHHFWGLDIDEIMASGGLSNRKVSREVIEIGFYAESKVTVSDKTAGTRLLEVVF